MADEEKKEVDAAAEAAPKKPAKEKAPAKEAAPAKDAAAKKGDAPAKDAAAEKKDVAEKDEAPAEDKEQRPTAAQLLSGDEELKGPAVPGRKAKGAKHVPVGVAHIKATFNNTMVSITDLKGNVVSWSAAGKKGFKGSRKSTAFAASQVAQEAAREAVTHGMHEVEVRVQGPGAGRESANRAIQAAGLTINAIRDVTPIPHNGCRPKKRRRV